jgi:SAM-dependent methyltransferase
VTGWQALGGQQARRWKTVLGTIVGMLPACGVGVLVDGGDDAGLSGLVADWIADEVRAARRDCDRLVGAAPSEVGALPCAADVGVVVADAASWRADPPAGGWDVVVRLRSRRWGSGEDGGPRADVIVDVDDWTWPVIRRVADRLAGDGGWHVRESQAFFGVRAATWDTKFGDDLPAYAAAVREMGLRAGAVVLDAGCGTGRALPALRDAAGPAGRVLGVDVTPQMLAATRRTGRAGLALLTLADARRLPMADGTFDGVFAAGLVHHLPDMAAGLTELARVSRTGARLAIFHPSGRASLAARHGRTLRPDERLSAVRLGPMLGSAGWRLDSYDDPPHRFLALATLGNATVAPGTDPR